MDPIMVGSAGGQLGTVSDGKETIMIKVGPPGQWVGTVWNDKGRDQIAKIFVTHSGASIASIPSIASLQFLFVDDKGDFVLSDRYGDKLGPESTNNFTTVVLDYPSEYITWIRGFTYYYGVHGTPYNKLASITFGTNKDSYGPYGMKTIPAPSPPTDYDYTEFDLQSGEDDSFGGFHGTQTDTIIESIGIYVKAIASSM